MNQSAQPAQPPAADAGTGVAVNVYEGTTLAHSLVLAESLEFGRQQPDEQPPYAEVPPDSTAGHDGRRIIIAKLSENTISRRHVRLELLAPDRVRVTNLSSVNTIALGTAGTLEPGEARELALPAVVVLGKNERTLRVERAGAPVRAKAPLPTKATVAAEPVHPGEPLERDDFELESLAVPTMLPGTDSSGHPSSLDRLVAAERSSSETRHLVQWLQATMGVYQSAANSPDFLPKAAKAVVDIVGLDHAAVLRCAHGNWTVEAMATGHGSGGQPLADDDEWAPSRLVLEKVQQHKRTFWKTPHGGDDSRSSASLLDVQAYVAAPILNRDGAVVGAIYGDRRLRPGSISEPSISELEAMLVELLSCSVAAGLARVEQEQAAMKARVQFEQFFTPELSQQLERDPTLLDGKEAKVTVLFCDIRGFSRIAERIGAKLTFDWINDVMGALSESVIAHSGVLVDYIGDEVIAMWGAPDELPNHAELACRAALDMLQQLPGLNSRWRETLGEEMGVGIGINTGVARVGNTGSTRKFKYGPLGNTVNLASRVQGATKYVQSPLVITGDTVAEMNGVFPVRRLCSVEVVNIAEPVELFELDTNRQTRWPELKQQYETALAAYEQGEFREATQMLANLLSEYPSDGPTLLLLSRAVEMLAHAPDDFSPVWKLESK